MKSISAYWALLVGLLSAVAQAVAFYLRFGQWNTLATFMDYLFFFLAGSFGGSILVFFLNRQSSGRARWIVLIMFLMASPMALLMMLGGGLLGPIGLLIFPQLPWGLFSWSGSLLARYASRT